MNKNELIDLVAKEAKLTKATTKKAIDAILNVTTKTLKKGDKIVLVGFGTLSVVKRNARKGRDPRTQKPINIPAKKVVKFKAGASLASQIK